MKRGEVRGLVRELRSRLGLTQEQFAQRETTHEMQPADPRARRLAALYIACATVAGVLLVWLLEWARPELEARLEAWLTEDPEQVRGRFRLAFALLGLSLTLPVVGFSAYLWRLGSRIVRAQRFPAPGSRLIRDTPVVRGAAALRRGRLTQALAAALLLATVTLEMLFWFLMASLGVL